jgi:hypothetical protein
MDAKNPYAPPRQLDAPHPVPAPAPPAQRWPKIFGIISCVLAAQGIVFTPLVELFNRWSDANRRLYELFPAWYSTCNTANQAGTLLSCAILLAGGALLMRRRPVAVALHVVYAALALVLTVVATAAYLTAVAAIDTSALSTVERAGVTGGTIGAVCGGLFGILYPIFLFAWFTRGKIRRDVRGWRGAPRPQAAP